MKKFNQKGGSMDKLLQLGVQYKIKSLDKYKDKYPDGLIISGIANRAIKDSVGDLILPEEFRIDRKNIMPILFNHNRDAVIGKVLELNVTDKGLEVIAYIDPIAEEEYKIITKIRKELLQTFSIGFIPLDYEYDKETDTWILKDVEILEISVVSVPCNSGSIIEEIKSISNNKRSKPNKFKGGEVMDKELLEAIKSLKEDLKKPSVDPEVVKDLEGKLKELLEDKEGLIKDVESVKSGIKDLDIEIKNVKELTSEITSLKEVLESVKAELEEVKSAPPKIEVKTLEDSEFEKNIDKYEDVFVSSQIYKKEYKDTLAFNKLPERLKSVNLDTSFTNKVGKKFLEDIRSNTVVADLFQDFSDVSTTTEEFPFAPNVTASFSTLTLSNADLTNKVTFSLKSLLAGVEWNYASEEESIVNWLPILRRKLKEAIADKLDSEICALTPSTGGFKGLLGYANGAGFVYTDSSTTNILDSSKIMELKKIMGKYAVTPKDAVIIVNTSKYLQLLDDPNILTVDKMGKNAVILKGQLASLYGSPIVITENITLNDTDAADNFSAVMVNRNMFGIKMKDLKVEMDKTITSQNKVIVVSTRTSFIPLVPLSGGELPSEYPIVAAVENG